MSARALGGTAGRINPEGWALELENAKRAARREGYDSFWAGVPPTANPYSDWPRRSAWLAGRDKAAAEAAIRGVPQRPRETR